MPRRVGLVQTGEAGLLRIVERAGAFQPGGTDSVIPAFSMNDYGVYAELAVVPAAAVLPRPHRVRPDRRGRHGGARAGDDGGRRVFLYGNLSGEPAIESTFPFERVADARRHLESNRQFGKVVLIVP
jgi:NADPH:quinone reductase-like Zn-dependent oxidoreductase